MIYFLRCKVLIGCNLVVRQVGHVLYIVFNISANKVIFSNFFKGTEKDTRNIQYLRVIVFNFNITFVKVLTVSTSNVLVKNLVTTCWCAVLTVPPTLTLCACLCMEDSTIANTLKLDISKDILFIVANVRDTTVITSLSCRCREVKLLASSAFILILECRISS